MSEEVLRWILGGGVIWLGWLTLIHFKDRKEMHEKMHEVETSVTVVKSDYLTYRQFVEELDKRFTPIQELVTAIAVQEHVVPDRRKK